MVVKKVTTKKKVVKKVAKKKVATDNEIGEILIEKVHPIMRKLAATYGRDRMAYCLFKLAFIYLTLEFTDVGIKKIVKNLFEVKNEK